MNKLALLVALLLVVVACKSEKESGKKPGEATASGKVTSPEATKAKKPRTKLEQAKFEALVDAWLAAQNKGDFEAYSKLYAAKFSGVKRVGAKTSRYARKDWLDDRKRMFKKKMEVEARERDYNISYASGQVSFTQRWASGKYEDLGPKRILAVLENGQLRIAQEEMIASEVLRSKDDGKKGGFYFVVDGGMVLPDAPVPEKHGKPEEGTSIGDEEIFTSATVKESDLDESVMAWKGKKVRVDGECEATVTGFKLISRLTPHFGTEQQWSCTNGLGEPEEDCQPASEEERAAEAFGEGEPQVLALLSDCDGSYARPIERAKIVVGDEVSDKALTAKATAAFGKLAEVAEQADAENKTWWQDAGVTIDIYKHPKSGQVLVSAYADNGGMCGEFSASAWQVWEAKNGKLKKLASGSAPRKITGAIDTDNDGALELLVEADAFGTERALVNSTNLETQISDGFAYHDCPC